MQTESSNTNGSINIDQIKQSELLNYDGIQETLLCSNFPREAWKEHAKNFQEEDFIKAVWSLVEHCRRNDAFCQQCREFISDFVVNSKKKIYFQYTDIYNFFWCLWKLNIKPSELPENIRSILIPNKNEAKLTMRVFDEGSWRLNLIDCDFIMWFLDSGDLSKSQIYNFQYHHDYTFSSYERFENFVNSDGNKYKIKLHVQVLHDVLKQKSADDKYFSKDEFINLIKKGKIIFKDPGKLATSNLPDSEFLVNVTGYSEDYDLKRQEKLPQTKKDYWEYVKKQLFGDPQGTVKGLLDIRKLETDDIKEILSWILIIDNDGKFAFLNTESNDSNEKDIFHVSRDCFTTKVDNELSRIDFCDLSKIQNETDREKLEFFVNDLLKYKDMILNPSKYKHELKLNNMQPAREEMSESTPEQPTTVIAKNMENKSKKIVTGIVLITIGIVLCVIDLIALGLASKLAVVLFLLSLLILAIGIICLVWEKIFDCIHKCDPQIFTHNTHNIEDREIQQGRKLRENSMNNPIVDYEKE